jgi:hypothetical protein
MRRIIGYVLSAMVAVIFVSGVLPAMAGKPQRDGVFIGNGYPSGPHYNLNIKAKNPDTFTCPDQADVMKYYCPDALNMNVYGADLECNEVCNATCIPVYGNVINFPQGDGSSNFSILMESGKEKPKGKPTTPANYPDLLEVTDWCMGFENNDNAAFRLPADPDGYAVYARLVGDPKEEPSFDFTNPLLSYVEDNNQDLLLLGYVANGVFNPAGEEIETISRTKGKKVSTATEITPLFMWEGDVCTFIDWDDGGIPTDQCCTDAEPVGEPDGIYEDCGDTLATDQCCNSLGECYTPDTPSVCDEGYVFTSVVCADGYTPEVVYCITYGDPYGPQPDPVWVFNIAEFVGMIFDIDPAGDYKASLIKLRFYPLPLDVKEQ